MTSNRNLTLFRLTSFFGLGFFFACIVHLFFASRTLPHHAHIPVQEGYLYGQIIPIALALSGFTCFAVSISRQKPALSSAIIWFSCFLFILILRLADWPGIGTTSILIGLLLISLFSLLGSLSNRLNLYFKKGLAPQATGYASVFLSFLVTTRLVQALSFNHKLPLDKSFISFHQNSRRHSADCRPVHNSIYSETSAKTLVIVLDAFPVESLFRVIGGRNSSLHQFLKTKSDIYRESYTKIPYTPLSLAYLLAGIEPNAHCSYPSIDGSRALWLAFRNNYVFQTRESVCNNKSDSLYSLLQDAFGRKLGSDLPRARSRDCSLANQGIIDKLLVWSVRNSSINDLRVIHDLFFHDYGKTPKDYLEIDSDYSKSLNLLIDRLADANVDLDQIIVMSDHGPRTGKFGKLLPGQVVSIGSMKFRDYYSTFYAVFRLKKGAKPGALPVANAKVFYQINEYGYPSRVFVSP